MEWLAHCSRAYHVSMEQRISSVNTFLETSLGLLNVIILILHDFLLLLFNYSDRDIVQLCIIVCSVFHTCTLILNLNLNVNVHEF